MTDNQDNENVLVACTIGIMFLMFALACAIFLGTSQLIPSEPYTDLSGQVSGLSLIFIFCSLIGGYFTSYGFLYILRDSRRTESTTQE